METKIVAALQNILNLIESMNWRINDLEQKVQEYDSSMSMDIKEVQIKLNELHDDLNSETK